MNLGFKDDSRFGKDGCVRNFFETLSSKLSIPSVFANVSMKTFSENHEIKL